MPTDFISSRQWLKLNVRHWPTCWVSVTTPSRNHTFQPLTNHTQSLKGLWYHIFVQIDRKEKKMQLRPWQDIWSGWILSWWGLGTEQENTPCMEHKIQFLEGQQRTNIILVLEISMFGLNSYREVKTKSCKWVKLFCCSAWKLKLLSYGQWGKENYILRDQGPIAFARNVDCMLLDFIVYPPPFLYHHYARCTFFSHYIHIKLLQPKKNSSSLNLQRLNWNSSRNNHEFALWQ